MNDFGTKVALRLLRLYQISISPLLGPSCRFEPSCSRYAAVALEKFGLARGSWLAARRVARCHPFGSSGFDPVPGQVGDGS
jgi:putative membrane protein insertion efficiency factor